MVVLAVSLREVDETVGLLLLIDIVVVLIALFLLGFLAAVVVRLGLRTRMEWVTAEITAGNLDRRVPDADSHTEPGRLGGALNLMSDRSPPSRGGCGTSSPTRHMSCARR